MQRSSQRPRDIGPQASKRQILARAAALSSLPEGLRCEGVKELMRGAIANGLRIEEEIFQAAYGDPRGQKYWESHLSERLSVDSIADLLSAHLQDQDLEESKSAIVSALNYALTNSEILWPLGGGLDPRYAAQWLLSMPKRAHLVPLSLRPLLSRQNSTSTNDMTPPGHLSRAMGKRGPKPETLQRVVEAMRCDIKSGQYTAASLGTMLEKNLAERYGVSRDTARKARAMVLSKIVENSNHRK
jgi:Bacterial regulatory proteins, gntR family